MVMISEMLTMALIKVEVTRVTKCKYIRSVRKAGSHHDVRAGIVSAAGPLGPTLGAVGLRALSLALEKNMNSIGIPATAAMPPSRRYVVRQPKSSNRKTVSSGTNDEAIPVEQSVTARDRPRDRKSTRLNSSH